MGNYIEDRKLSLLECKKILNVDGIFYTDEEIIELRDWLYHLSEIVLDEIDREENEKQIEAINKKNEHPLK